MKKDLIHRRVLSVLFVFILLIIRQTGISDDSPRLKLDWVALNAKKSVGMSPHDIYWSEDGKRIFFRWNPKREKDRFGKLYSIPPEGGTPAPVPDSDIWKLPGGNGDRNKQETYTVYEKYGDIFLMDLRSGLIKRIFKTEKRELSPQFLKDGHRFTFEMDSNLFLYDITEGTVKQLTDIRSGEDPEKKSELSEVEEYLKRQQAELFGILKDRKEDKEYWRQAEKREDPKPMPCYLGSPKKRVIERVPSPDGKYVGIVVEDTSKAEQARIDVMPRYVTESGFVETQPVIRGKETRGKVGSPIVTTRTGVYEVETGKLTWPDADLKDREVNHNSPIWSDDGSRLAYVIGSVDDKDRWIAVYDIKTGKTEIVDHERDDAWLNNLRTGRGKMSMPWFGFNYFGWLKDNDSLYFISERDGWMHLYTCQISTKKIIQLTKGGWEVDFLKLSKDKSKFYFTTSEIHPGERQLYSMPTAGGKRVQLTSKKGWNFPYFSPDESKIAVLHSTSNTPVELFVMSNRPGTELKQLTDSTTPEFKALHLPQPQIITFPDADGNLIYGDLYSPAQVDGKAPAVLFVHGAGYAQAVYNRWFDDWPAEERLLNHYLSQQGYVVLSIDYRGSAGYGRDCRTAVYRHMGGKDVDSALAAVEYLEKYQNVDRGRIGIYGSSYGGFFTLMALFTHPGVFHAGVAEVAATDWVNYDHGFTAQVLGLPYENEEAYRKSSPLFFASGLQDHLLIIHGIEDNNVLVEDTMRLVQRLIELKKENWDYLVYPTEGHLASQEGGRLDYCRRLVRFFDQHLRH